MSKMFADYTKKIESNEKCLEIMLKICSIPGKSVIASKLCDPALSASHGSLILTSS